MNIHTGKLINPEIFETFNSEEKAKYVEVKRDLTEKEKALMQIKLYAPCACGSGKKFKFCCRKTL